MSRILFVRSEQMPINAHEYWAFDIYAAL